MTVVGSALEALKHEYVALHERKEGLFWTTKMGLADEPERERREFADAEKAWQAFLQDPARLAGLRALEGEAATAEERAVLDGWVRMLGAHVVEDPAARKLAAEIVEREVAIEEARAGMKLGYVDPASGTFIAASSIKLGLMMRSDPDEAIRRAAFDGLRSIETFVLEHGFLDIVKMRNRLARLLGYEDYYAYRVQVVERMTKARLFEVLDDLANKTAERTRAELAQFAFRHGDKALRPWNFPFYRSGKLAAGLDPYFGFAPALDRWARSFHALGVRFRGATLTLDLLDRPGKYENGFMHGPGLAYFDNGAWRPARVNFTANAVLGQRGAGERATMTLFHEGGHAAHFSNILSNAPCFSQEFAPTSVGYAETQSMFMDSLIRDPDWQRRYATDDSGAPVPMDLIEAQVRERLPFRAWDVRALMTVPFAERALYEISDDALRPEVVLEVFRGVEVELQGLVGGGARPVLAVPHLLGGESSAYYHGYVLAEMAVQQTRAFFLARDGHLVDNPKVGRDLAEHYWKPGNAATFDETLTSLTGEPLGPRALADACNESVEAALVEARTRVDALRSIPRVTGAPELDARVDVVHGKETVASTVEGGMERAAADFARWARGFEIAFRRSSYP